MSPNPLDETARLQRVHARWLRLQAVFGAGPVFAVINRFHPMLTDAYGRDLLPALLPAGVREHYPVILAAALAGLAASEILRRRFQALHKDDLDL